MHTNTHKCVRLDFQKCTDDEKTRWVSRGREWKNLQKWRKETTDWLSECKVLTKAVNNTAAGSICLQTHWAIKACDFLTVALCYLFNLFGITSATCPSPFRLCAPYAHLTLCKTGKGSAMKTIDKTIFIGFHRYDFAIGHEVAGGESDERRAKLSNESDYIIWWQIKLCKMRQWFPNDSGCKTHENYSVATYSLSSGTKCNQLWNNKCSFTWKLWQYKPCAVLCSKHGFVFHHRHFARAHNGEYGELWFSFELDSE